MPLYLEYTIRHHLSPYIKLILLQMCKTNEIKKNIDCIITKNLHKSLVKIINLKSKLIKYCQSCVSFVLNLVISFTYGNCPKLIVHTRILLNQNKVSRSNCVMMSQHYFRINLVYVKCTLNDSGVFNVILRL